jgi:hypothetical protein
MSLFLKDSLKIIITCSVDGKEGIPDQWRIDGAVRALDYKAQYKVCEAFNKLSKGFDWSDRLMFQRFEESFTIIDAENQEEHFVELRWAVNDMDNVLYETDVYSPEEFYKVVRAMAEVIDVRALTVHD